MIEAKDKEQAVFELMRIFKLPGFTTFNDIIPHVRTDENKPWRPPKKAKKTPKKKKPSTDGELDAEDDEDVEVDAQPPPLVPDSDVGMGGAEGRVYWPPGMEEWLRPKKREVKPRDPAKAKTTAERAALRRAEKAAWQAVQEAGNASTADVSACASDIADGECPKGGLDLEKAKSVYDVPNPKKPVRAPRSSTTRGKKSAKAVPTPSTSDQASDLDEHESNHDIDMPDLTDAEETVTTPVAKKKRNATMRTLSGRGAKRKAMNYAEDDTEDSDQ